MVNEPPWLTGTHAADYPRSVRRSHSSTSHTEASAVHDLVIDNARIIDGLGRPAREGAVAVAGGRIAAVGRDVGAARRRIDAQGLVLAPGIVDIHTHYDAQLTWDPFATPSTALGVTTVVIGNCGFTIAPCRPQHRDVVMRNLTHVEGMSLEAMRAGISWDFETYPEYLASIERRGVVPNVASFVGHSSVRTYVLGEDASRRPASDAEITQMRRLVHEAVTAGAIGFATSTLEQHNGEGGIPMPSRLADEKEMLALTGALGEVEQARSRGCELWAQVGCFPLGMEFTLRHPYPLEALMAWRPALEAPSDARYRQLLADPSFRRALILEMGQPGVPNRISNENWDHLTVMEVKKPALRHLQGKIIGQMAREQKREPWDVFLDLGLEDDLDTMFDCRLFNTDEQKVSELLRHPCAAVALSDAGAHLSFLCDAGFGLHLFGHWVRERGDLTLPQAVAR